MRITKSVKASENVESCKPVTASSKTGVVYDKNNLVLTLTDAYNAFTSSPDDVIGYIENTSNKMIDLSDYGHDQFIEPGKTELHPVEEDYFLINYILEMDETPLTKEQVKELWDTTPMYIVWDDGSDSLCQENDYSLEEILNYVDHGYCVYIDGDYTDSGITSSTKTGENNMRIVKSNKAVKASNETGDSDIPTYKQAEEILDCNDWEEFGFSCEEECDWFKKKAKKLLDERDGVKACGDVKASKKLSANDQALTHIKAAIDILGKSGNKDEVTKDSIANLGVVMFDLMGDK